jgi:transcriptional regulator with XRE-family HTH domain
MAAPSTSNLVFLVTGREGMVARMGFAENIKRLREREGLSQLELAKKAGVSQQLISQLESGKNLTTKKLPQIVKALNATLDQLDETLARDLWATSGGLLRTANANYSGRELTGAPLAYGGIVKAGAFRAVDEYFNQDEIAVPAFVQANPRFARARQFTWQVEGSSMDEVGIEDGMWVVGADYGDYVDYYGEVESGQYVVVERSRHQGSERELTVKEIRFYRDRYELIPHSSDKTHVPIVVKNDLEVDGDQVTVRILAKVLAAYRDFS